jgi:hypothetical protein
MDCVSTLHHTHGQHSLFISTIQFIQENIMATIVTNTPAVTPVILTVEEQRIHDLALQVILDTSRTARELPTFNTIRTLNILEHYEAELATANAYLADPNVTAEQTAWANGVIAAEAARPALIAAAVAAM